jgi:LacI family transcriptional regulator
MLSGIEDYIRTNGPWSVYLPEHGRGDAVPQWLMNWDGDGVIARIESQEIADALGSTGLPVVNLSFRPLLPGAPTFTTENQGIARLAVAHFLERGFRHFAYCGLRGFPWSIDRGACFERELASRGLKCDHFPEHESSPGFESQTVAIAKWLATLPRPLAVLACYDYRAQHVLDACRRDGFAVPDEVAVLGVDNDDLLCALSPPPLSSVILDPRRSGWLAAETLEKLMRGEKVEPVVTYVPPLGVATRQSTDTLAVEDGEVARALRYIRKHACAGVTVTELLRTYPMSRRALETKMKAVIGRTPHEEILRVQIERAKELLASTKMPLPDVAERCGFRHAEYLSVAFKRETGMPPSTYRHQHGRSG